MNVGEKKIVVVGLGKTGSSLARFLKGKGALVTAVDKRDEAALGSTVADLKKIGIRIELGDHRQETFENCDLIVLSPGVPHTLKEIQKAAEKGIPVTGEIELAWNFIRTPIIAVTGTNGKTTVTTLIAKMLETSGLNVFTGGNIGTPLMSEPPADIIVLEISSFQLDTIKNFNPQTGVLLNISKDHLDRYDGFDDYIFSKGRIFENHKEGQTAIISGSDPNVRNLSKAVAANHLYFNGKGKDEKGAEFSKNSITLDLPNGKRQKIDTSSAKLTGVHNIENIAAAALATLYAGGTVKAVEKTINEFKGLAHRIEFIEEINGIKFYNDSKATNTGAVKTALESFGEKIILIMGGRDKEGGYSILKKSIRGRVKRVIAMGEAKDLIYSELEGTVPVTCLADMEAAVKEAFVHAEKGDVVLLSPACSSFDYYPGYAKRGEHFSMLVKRTGAKI